MMKLKILLVLLIPFLGIAQYQNKTGINTEKPEKELHVNGTAKTDELFLNTIETLSESEDYRFLIKSPSNKITSFNEGVFADLTPSPINRIKFVINFNSSNTDHDWVNLFNTKINYSKYLCVIASYSYNLPVNSSFSAAMTPIPQIYTTKHPTLNTWVLKADYESFAPSAAQYTAKNGQWILEVLIFDRNYAKEFSNTVNMNGSSTGMAANALVTGY